jgi:glucosamine kinase
MSLPLRYVIGVDGGGSGTRARVQDPAGRTLATGAAGPSGLSQGVAQAWRHVREAIDEGLAAAALPAPPDATHCALGVGLAGAGSAELRKAFIAAAPPFARLVVDTDIRALVVGAFGRAPGLVVAAGTGSIATRQSADGSLHRCGGWGFPVGDEGSGAWLGLRAAAIAQAALDGRATGAAAAGAQGRAAGRVAGGALAHAVVAATGGSVLGLRQWCAGAGQYAFASLAPLVFDAASAGDAQAQALLQQAADALAAHAHALDTAGAAPIVVAGSIGTRLAALWSHDLKRRLVAPRGDACDGALALVRAAMGGE